MLTRRRALAVGMTAQVWAGVSRLIAYTPVQFWNERPAAEWSEKEIEQLLGHSPWAKQAEAQFKMPDGGMGGPPGGGMGGPPGGGTGGPPGGMGGMPLMKATVRWESAAPVIEARKRQPDSGTEENYIVSVSGLPLFGGRPPGMGAEAPAGGERPDRPAPNAEQRKAMIGSLKQSSALQRKGKDPIAASRVGELEGSETPTLLFHFPRATSPITLADKEVTFITQIGPLQLKVKFALKDMLYHGQISL